jgi:hypothetical protein
MVRYDEFWVHFQKNLKLVPTRNVNQNVKSKCQNSIIPLQRATLSPLSFLFLLERRLPVLLHLHDPHHHLLGQLHPLEVGEDVLLLEEFLVELEIVGDLVGLHRPALALVRRVRHLRRLRPLAVPLGHRHVPPVERMELPLRQIDHPLLDALERRHRVAHVVLVAQVRLHLHQRELLLGLLRLARRDHVLLDHVRRAARPVGLAPEAAQVGVFAHHCEVGFVN